MLHSLFFDCFCKWGDTGCPSAKNTTTESSSYKSKQNTTWRNLKSGPHKLLFILWILYANFQKQCFGEDFQWRIWVLVPLPPTTRILLPCSVHCIPTTREISCSWWEAEFGTIWRFGVLTKASWSVAPVELQDPLRETSSLQNYPQIKLVSN